MKMTVGDFKDMRGEDMPIILGNCKYVTGYSANETIDGPWGWMVHTGDCDPLNDCNYMANDDMGFHFLWNGLDFVEVDTGECDPIAWYPTFEDAEDRYNDLNGWND